MTQVHASAYLVTSLIGTAIPALTSLLTKLSAHPLLKALIAAFLSAVTAFLVQAQLSDGSAVFSKRSVLLALIVFGVSQLSYLALYKPNNVNQKLAPNVGIGGGTAPQG